MVTHTLALVFPCVRADGAYFIALDSLVNKLVMNYLVTEGYPETAQILAAEANMAMDSEVSPIQERLEIRNLIYAGDIQNAIERINEVNPQV